MKFSQLQMLQYFGELHIHAHTVIVIIMSQLVVCVTEYLSTSWHY